MTRQQRKPKLFELMPNTFNKYLSVSLLLLIWYFFKRQTPPYDEQSVIRAVGNPGFSPAAALVMQLYREGKLSGENSILRGKNLMGANWQKVILPDVDLEGTNLRYADLRNTILYRSNLTKTDFRDAKLVGVDLRATKLIGANFMQADWTQANSNGAKASRLSLFMARAVRAEMRRITLEGADLQEADLHGAHLEHADLRNAHLRDTNFAKALMENAILSGARMMNANLTGADLFKAHFDEHTVLPDAKFVGFGEDRQAIFDKYWTPETDMARYTDPQHPDFWEPKWVRKYEWVQRNYDED